MARVDGENMYDPTDIATDREAWGDLTGLQLALMKQFEIIGEMEEMKCQYLEQLSQKNTSRNCSQDIIQRLSIALSSVNILKSRT